MAVKLRRSLSLTLLALYGIGTMVGAGIYVLLGQTARMAGMQTPLAYLLAAAVVIPTALSFGELASRFPKSAGEAVYVKAGLDSDRLSLIVGLLVIAAGTVSAASITIGAVGYLQTFYSGLSTHTGIVIIALGLGLLAAWGISQSVVVASLFAIIEVGGLVVIVVSGAPEVIAAEIPFSQYFIPADNLAWTGILGAAILAFYAFIGFEDMVNIAEEVKHPRRTLPLGIIIALLVTTLIYLSIAIVAVTVVPLATLTTSVAPLGIIFKHTTGLPVQILNAIGIMAALNGILIQLIMAPRVLYGLSCQGGLPEIFSRLHPVTQTPLIATLFITASVLLLALIFPIEVLARWTSLIALSVFTLCNLALIKIKKSRPVEDNIFTTPVIVPVIGLVISLGFLGQEIMQHLP